MKDMAADVIGDRIQGSRPGRLRALLVAAAAGITVAVVTYKLLRMAD